MRRGPARDAACVPHATRRSRGTAKRSIDRQWVGRHPRPVMHSSPLDVLVQQSSRRASASLLRYTYSMPTPTPLCGDPRSVPQDNHVSNIRRRLFPVRDTECNSAVLRCLCASSAGNTSETTFALRVRCVTWEDDTQGAADERPALLHGFPPLLVEVQITRPPARDAPLRSPSRLCGAASRKRRSLLCGLCMRRGPARDAACVPHATRRSRGTAKRSIDRQWVGRHPRPVMHSSPLDVLVQQSSRRASASLLRYTYSMPTPTPLCGDPRSVPQDNHVSNIRRRLFPVPTRSAILLCCAACALLQRETLRRRRSRCESAV